MNKCLIYSKKQPFGTVYSLPFHVFRLSSFFPGPLCVRDRIPKPVAGSGPGRGPSGEGSIPSAQSPGVLCVVPAWFPETLPFALAVFCTHCQPVRGL